MEVLWRLRQQHAGLLRQAWRGEEALEGACADRVSAAALRRADAAARAEGVSRSEFIRTAVERRLEEISVEEFERELAEACIANNQRNLELLKEFEHVDREAWAAIP